VTGLRGPLRDGELARAYAWGVGLSGLVLESHPAGPIRARELVSWRGALHDRKRDRGNDRQEG
jgi:hypothetical protein